MGAYDLPLIASNSEGMDINEAIKDAVEKGGIKFKLPYVVDEDGNAKKQSRLEGTPQKSLGVNKDYVDNKKGMTFGKFFDEYISLGRFENLETFYGAGFQEFRNRSIMNFLDPSLDSKKQELSSSPAFREALSKLAKQISGLEEEVKEAEFVPQEVTLPEGKIPTVHGPSGKNDFGLIKADKVASKIEEVQESILLGKYTSKFEGRIGPAGNRFLPMASSGGAKSPTGYARESWFTFDELKKPSVTPEKSALEHLEDLKASYENILEEVEQGRQFQKEGGFKSLAEEKFESEVMQLYRLAVFNEGAERIRAAMRSEFDKDAPYERLKHPGVDPREDPTPPRHEAKEYHVEIIATDENADMYARVFAGSGIIPPNIRFYKDFEAMVAAAGGVRNPGGKKKNSGYWAHMGDDISVAYEGIKTKKEKFEARESLSMETKDGTVNLHYGSPFGPTFNAGRYADYGIGKQIWGHDLWDKKKEYVRLIQDTANGCE